MSSVLYWLVMGIRWVVSVKPMYVNLCKIRQRYHLDRQQCDSQGGTFGIASAMYEQTMTEGWSIPEPVPQLHVINEYIIWGPYGSQSLSTAYSKEQQAIYSSIPIPSGCLQIFYYIVVVEKISSEEILKLQIYLFRDLYQRTFLFQEESGRSNFSKKSKNLLKFLLYWEIL